MPSTVVLPTAVLTDTRFPLDAFRSSSLILLPSLGFRTMEARYGRLAEFVRWLSSRSTRTFQFLSQYGNPFPTLQSRHTSYHRSKLLQTGICGSTRLKLVEIL